jgi:hypothetical protein
MEESAVCVVAGEIWIGNQCAEYCHVFNEEPLHEKNICWWDKELKGMGSFVEKNSSERPSVC